MLTTNGRASFCRKLDYGSMFGGINTWMDAAIQIDSLPKLHVAVSQAKRGQVAPLIRVA